MFQKSVLISLALPLAAALTGCGRTLPVEPALLAEAKAYIAQETGSPTPLEFDDAWMMNASAEGQTICGEFHGLPLLGEERVRYLYMADNDYGQVEMHRYWVTASPVSQAIMEENRRLFDKLWDDHCKPYRPGLMTREANS
jgi:hypothetical protein